MCLWYEGQIWLQSMTKESAMKTLLVSGTNLIAIHIWPNCLQKYCFLYEEQILLQNMTQQSAMNTLLVSGTNLIAKYDLTVSNEYDNSIRDNFDCKIWPNCLQHIRLACNRNLRSRPAFGQPRMNYNRTWNIFWNIFS